jgi:hypothetical protein
MYSLDDGVIYVIAALSPSVKLYTLDIKTIDKYNEYYKVLEANKDYIVLGLEPANTPSNEIMNEEEIKAIEVSLDKNFKPPRITHITRKKFCAVSISDIQSMAADATMTIDNTKRKYVDYEQSMTFLYHLFNDKK